MDRLRALSVVVGAAFLITPVTVPAVHAVNRADANAPSEKIFTGGDMVQKLRWSLSSTGWRDPQTSQGTIGDEL